MASADELKALGNKAMSDKNFDDAMYVCPRNTPANSLICIADLP